jgi:hypothetical protein
MDAFNGDPAAVIIFVVNSTYAGVEGKPATAHPA